MSESMTTLLCDTHLGPLYHHMSYSTDTERVYIERRSSWDRVTVTRCYSDIR